MRGGGGYGRLNFSQRFTTHIPSINYLRFVSAINIYELLYCIKIPWDKCMHLTTKMYLYYRSIGTSFLLALLLDSL